LAKARLQRTPAGGKRLEKRKSHFSPDDFPKGARIFEGAPGKKRGVVFSNQPTDRRTAIRSMHRDVAQRTRPRRGFATPWGRRCHAMRDADAFGWIRRSARRQYSRSGDRRGVCGARNGSGRLAKDCAGWRKFFPRRFTVLACFFGMPHD
jgi:hypothetical protein